LDSPARPTLEDAIMPMRTLAKFLDEQQIRYVRITHSPAYTAQEIAASAHIPGRELAKTVMVKLDGKMQMVVTCASCQIDLEELKRAVSAREVSLATEDEFRGLFPECELGAMPPFGNLFDMQVFVTEELAEDEEIAFNAGSHTELVRMSYRDFARLVEPTVLDVTAKVS
jgi:Ala-tRNA(Pro) deacylase